MSQIKTGDLVIHRMSKVPLFDFKTTKKEYSSSAGLVLEVNKDKLLILWDSYTEWVDYAYLLIVSKVG